MKINYKWRPKSFAHGATVVAGVLAIAVGLIALQTAIIMWAWNAVVHGMFNGPSITFWQTIGLQIVVGFFTSFFRKHKFEK